MTHRQGEIREILIFEFKLFQDENLDIYNKAEFRDFSANLKFPKIHPKYGYRDFPIQLKIADRRKGNENHIQAEFWVT